jgi:signal transduction histidine kinase
MSWTVSSTLSALLWSAIAALGIWLLLWPLRRRSLLGLLVSVVLTGTAASTGAVLGAMHSMLLPMGDEARVIVLTIAAGLIATGAAAAAGRRLVRENRTLREDIAAVASGVVPDVDGRPQTAEVERLRSELRSTATSLAETRDRERALESARRDLVSWVSHDLRTPLAGLRAMSEALEDGVAEAPDVYYKQILSSVDRLSGMVDDLFDLSRIQAGALTARDMERLSLDDLVSDCIAALRPLASASGVTLSGTPGGGSAVAGNGQELNRALTNLIANAIRHTRAAGVVDVRVEMTPTHAEVVVADECGGIPDTDLPRLFDVGFRGESARTPHSDDADHAGGGLGLAIARGIVEAHDGSVDVENTDVGCRFRVLLPVA